MADDHEAQLEEEALLEYAEHLGIDPIKHSKYMYIAKQALEAPLPEGWEQGEDDDGTPYYFRTDGEGESVWEYPTDEKFRQMFLHEVLEYVRAN